MKALPGAPTAPTPKAGVDFKALTGATYTSNGVAKAVGSALSVYGAMTNSGSGDTAHE